MKRTSQEQMEVSELIHHFLQFLTQSMQWIDLETRECKWTRAAHQIPKETTTELADLPSVSNVKLSEAWNSLCEYIMFQMLFFGVIFPTKTNSMF